MGRLKCLGREQIRSFGSETDTAILKEETLHVYIKMNEGYTYCSHCTMLVKYQANHGKTNQVLNKLNSKYYIE